MNDIVVVDTDVVSFMFKRDTRAALYDQLTGGKKLAISFATLAELDGWAISRRWGPAKQTRLEEHVRLYYAVYFPNRSLCRWWAIATWRAERNGRPIGKHDAWIAATALSLDVPLVTNNPKDYGGVDGLEVLSA